MQALLYAAAKMFPIKLFNSIQAGGAPNYTHVAAWEPARVVSAVPQLTSYSAGPRIPCVHPLYQPAWATLFYNNKIKRKHNTRRQFMKISWTGVLPAITTKFNA